MSKEIKKQTSSKERKKTSEKSTMPSKGSARISSKTQKKLARTKIVSNTNNAGVIAFFSAIFFLVLLGCGVYATKPLWAPYILYDLSPVEATTGDWSSRDLLADRINQLENEIMLVRESGQAISDLEIERNKLNKSFEGVMARIVAVEKQIADVRKMKKAMTPQTDVLVTNNSINRLNSRLIDLEKSDERARAVLERLNKLEQIVTERNTEIRSSAEGLLQTMTDISKRILTLEDDAAQSVEGRESVAEAKRQVRAQNLVLAVGHLRESLRSSDPFAESLMALRALGGEDPDIQNGVKELAPFAETGVKTIDELRREYDTLAENISRVAFKDTSKKDTESSLIDVFTYVKSLVSVRKIGADKPKGIESDPIAIARLQLDQGDLEGAIATLSDIHSPDSDVVAGWLNAARARLLAERVLSRLHVFVISILALSIK